MKTKPKTCRRDAELAANYEPKPKTCRRDAEFAENYRLIIFQLHIKAVTRAQVNKWCPAKSNPCNPWVFPARSASQR